MEKTYVMLKPDALQRGLAGEILTRIERKGLHIENMKMFMLNETILKEHYAHLKDKPFFPEIVEYMTSGPVVGIIVSGVNAVASMRKILGATNPLEAEVGTIRGDYALETRYNLVHASDSVENAQIEIERFFGNHAK